MEFFPPGLQRQESAVARLASFIWVKFRTILLCLLVFASSCAGGEAPPENERVQPEDPLSLPTSSPEPDPVEEVAPTSEASPAPPLTTSAEEMTIPEDAPVAAAISAEVDQEVVDSALLSLNDFGNGYSIDGGSNGLEPDEACPGVRRASAQVESLASAQIRVRLDPARGPNHLVVIRAWESPAQLALFEQTAREVLASCAEYEVPDVAGATYLFSEVGLNPLSETELAQGQRVDVMYEDDDVDRRLVGSGYSVMFQRGRFTIEATHSEAIATLLEPAPTVRIEQAIELAEQQIAQLESELSARSMSIGWPVSAQGRTAAEEQVLVLGEPQSGPGGMQFWECTRGNILFYQSGQWRAESADGSDLAEWPSGDETRPPAEAVEFCSSPDVVEPAAPIATLEPTPTPEPAGFGEGTQLVGADIEAGLYVTAAARNCYWERLSGFSGDLDDIIANDNLDGSFGFVEIAPGDAAFSSDRCGRWSLADEVELEQVEGFGDGDWLVGRQVEPGTYRTVAEVSSCYWERVRGYSGTFEELVANDNVSAGRAIVEVSTSDFGISTSRCGEWERVP